MEQLTAIIDKIVEILKDFFKALDAFLANKDISFKKWYED